MRFYNFGSFVFPLIVSVLIFTFITGIPTAAAVTPDERTALDALYANTNGPNWSDNSGWGGTTDSVPG